MTAAAATTTTTTTTTKSPPPNHQRKLWMELKQLLYCMESQPDPIDGNNNSHQNQSSWQSLLLRAQLAQDLWRQLQLSSLQSSSTTTTTNNNNTHHHHDHDHDDPSKLLLLARQVDQACRRAHELADFYRNKQQPAASILDTMFFHSNSQQQQQQQQQEESQQQDKDQEGNENEDDEFDLEDDEYESDNNNDGQQQQQQQQETGRNRVSSSLEDDLQQAQREQMEEAIAQMAKRMKDATKGIQHTLEQQTTNTLSQLEDVAEQNVQDVRIVSQNVQQHNTKRWRSQLGTWTLLFSLVGIWVFSLVTVFTIPKRPNACLLFCGKDSRLYRFTGSVVVRMTKSLQLLLTGDDNEDDDGDDETPDKDWEELYEDHDYEREQKEKLDALLQEIQEKETKKDIHQQEDLDWRQALDDEEDNPWGKKPVGKKTRRQEEDDADDNPWGKKPVDMEQRFEEEEEEEEADDNPWGMKPVDTVGGRKQQAVGEEEPDNPWGLKPEKNQDIVQKVSPDDVENRRDRQEGTTMEDDEGDQKRSPPPKVEDINMDDLLASLNQQAIKTKPSDLPSTDNFHRGQMPTPVKDANKRPTEEKKNKGFNPTDAFKRSHSRFSPRDVRVAASTGKHELVEQYLDQQPDVIDKKDKHGWSAIHLAARGGRTKTLEILIQHGAKLSDVTKDGFSPLQIAMDRLGKDHEATRVIVEALGMSTRQPETHHQHEVREMGRRKGEEEEPKIQEMGARKREEEAESPKVKEEEEAQRKIEEARRWAEEEEPEDFDEYVESARRHLDLLRVVEGAQVLPAEEEEEDFEKYVESGRSRLDSLLGPEENYGGRDEL